MSVLKSSVNQREDLFMLRSRVVKSRQMVKMVWQ